MPTVAEQLKRAREAANLTPERVAEVTKMKSDQVRALERGDFDAFPAAVFVRGFVKSYAAMLSLDTEAVLADLKAELGDSGGGVGGRVDAADKGSLDQVFDQLSRVKWSVALPVIFILLFLAVSGAVMKALDRRRSLDPAEGLGPGLYAPKEGAGADEYLPLGRELE